VLYFTAAPDCHMNGVRGMKHEREFGTEGGTGCKISQSQYDSYRVPTWRWWCCGQWVSSKDAMMNPMKNMPWQIPDAARCCLHVRRDNSDHDAQKERKEGHQKGRMQRQLPERYQTRGYGDVGIGIKTSCEWHYWLNETKFCQLVVDWTCVISKQVKWGASQFKWV